MFFLFPSYNQFSLLFLEESDKEKASCRLEQWNEKDSTTPVQATYWPEGWRQRLCRCAKCLVIRWSCAMQYPSLPTDPLVVVISQEMYSTKNLQFLLDEQDTVEWYEQKGKSESVNRPSHNDQMMAALSSLDRIQQVEAITGKKKKENGISSKSKFTIIWLEFPEYQSMSNELKEYLKKFADSKKVVRSEDITEFFSKLKERKRRRMDDGNSDGTPTHFCR